MAPRKTAGAATRRNKSVAIDTDATQVVNLR